MASPEAVVVSERFPYLLVTVIVRTQAYEVEALLDTGFTEYLILPEGSVGNGPPPDGYTVLVVADGRKIRAPFYEGKITIGQSPPVDAVITILGDEPILGLRVISKFKVILDHGVRVTVER